jgi:hypothetical protein
LSNEKNLGKNHFAEGCSFPDWGEQWIGENLHLRIRAQAKPTCVWRKYTEPDIVVQERRQQKIIKILKCITDTEKAYMV